MTVHINRPSSTRFQARVRLPGHRHYILVGRPTRSRQAAIMAMAKNFAKGGYHRADVVMTADYYDPRQIVELVRR